MSTESSTRPPRIGGGLRGCLFDLDGVLTRTASLIDGIVARERGLPGKPAPDPLLPGAAVLGLPPGEADVVVRDLAELEPERPEGPAIGTAFGRMR